MVAVKQIYTQANEPDTHSDSSNNRFRLIQGSFSSKKVARQYPLVAGFHKATDGALLGVLIMVTSMSAFALHWQHLWTVAFAKLDTTRDLSHRLIDSTAMLESHLLRNTNPPLSMVRTKASNLLYLARPNSQNFGTKKNFKYSPGLNRIAYQLANHGY